MAPSESASAVTRVTGKTLPYFSLFLSAHSLSKHTKEHAQMKEEDRQGIESQRTPVERRAAAALQREKAGEPERVQVELKETEKQMKRRFKRKGGGEAAQETRRQGFKTRSHQRAARVAGPGIS
ncbi:hypothetical protein M9H77_36758 [Catharanthus roseus]|uniref:Uncharacterized protein n=1 Tax=Catharanthus roseus TaxID=4058 RepID=A0ACB9ZUN9_CATRO|nr:hypothetical protein M9H77_36758 [Catharanthus roseus]